MEAPVGIESINEKKYPKTAERIPIITENIKIIISFSVRKRAARGGRAISPKTGSAPRALVVTATIIPTVNNKIVLRNLTGYLYKTAVS